MEHDPIHFEPWQGALFKSGEGPLGSKRLLVLGEAHYSNEPTDERSTLTQEIICRLRNRDPKRQRIPYFTKLERFLAGPDESDESRLKTVWDSIAFYNYVQGYAATVARKAPTAEMWKAARLPFAKVLLEVKPDRVLVTGVRLWNALSHGLFDGWSSTPVETDTEESLFRWTSRDGTQHAIATWTYHLSGGFGYSRWRPRLKRLLEQTTSTH